jgi:glycosyltransferase involved in cell wall biosynthesis
LGKGEAIRAGLNFVSNTQPRARNTKIIGYLDADGAFDQIDIKEMISESCQRLSIDCGFGVLIASRIKLAGRQISRDTSRHYLGRIISTYICFGWTSAPYDTQSGFKLFTFDSIFRKAIQTPFKTSWFFDIELLLRLQDLGFGSVWESPISSWQEISGSSLNFKKSLKVLSQIRKVKSLVKAFNKERMQ